MEITYVIMLCNSAIIRQYASASETKPCDRKRRSARAFTVDDLEKFKSQCDEKHNRKQSEKTF